ncbi:MAG: hypothetical protein IKZ91_01495 [Bacteroidales bacterium]|nr:hypothetical protein [Bacteroidales bacterium]
MKRLAALIFTGVAALLVQGCCLVDEDLSDCVDEVEVTMNYELRMVTNMKTEIQTQLSMATDMHVSAALQAHLAGIFTDYARDVDLGFYDVVRNQDAGDSLRLEHMERTMNANESSFTLNIPFRDYMHLAVANCLQSGGITLNNSELCHHSQLSQPNADVVESHKAGLFTARLGMSVLEGVNQQFHVNLYMANCAAALVLDQRSADVTRLEAYTTGFATGFNICDSTYTFRREQKVKADIVVPEEGSEFCFVSVSFPSMDPEETRVVIETEDPFIAEEQDYALWEYLVYATLSDGSITESRLRVRVPLRAGQLKIIHARMTDDGVVNTEDPTVAVSVSLDWGNGPTFNPDL